MTQLALTTPDGKRFDPPSGVPTGGLDRAGEIFRNGLTLLLIVTVVLSLIFIVTSGIQWITSGGDKTKLQAARARLTWAVVGLVVAFTSFFVVSALGYLFNVNLLGFGS